MDVRLDLTFQPLREDEEVEAVEEEAEEELEAVVEATEEVVEVAEEHLVVELLSLQLSLVKDSARCSETSSESLKQYSKLNKIIFKFLIQYLP